MCQLDRVPSSESLAHGRRRFPRRVILFLRAIELSQTSTTISHWLTRTAVCIGRHVEISPSATKTTSLSVSALFSNGLDNAIGASEFIANLQIDFAFRPTPSLPSSVSTAISVSSVKLNIVALYLAYV